MGQQSLAHLWQNTQPQKGVNYWYVQERGWIPEGWHCVHYPTYIAFWERQHSSDGKHVSDRQKMLVKERDFWGDRLCLICGYGYLTLHLSSIVQYSLAYTPKGTSITVYKLKKNLCYVLSCFSRVQLFATPWDCSPPASSVHGILQARILEWVAIYFFRGSSQPRDWTCVSCLADGFFTNEPPGD